MRFTVRPDRRLIRSTYRSNRFVLVELTAPIAELRRERAPVNLAFVIDRSGSMSGRKLGLAKQAVEEAIGRLRADDRFAVVVYDDRVDVVVESTAATPQARRDAVAHLATVDARANTNLAEGWLRGCEQVALNLAASGVNRCLLLTDGLANVGVTDPQELERHASELRARGVQTSTFGIGEDFDEALLQAMADAGGGHVYYIESPVQIPDLISSEVGEALEVVARDVALEITAAEGIEIESISPFHFSARGARTTVSVGDVVSEQQVRVVLRLQFPFGEIGREVGALVALADRDGALDAEAARLAWEYADNRTNDLQPRDVEVDRAVAAVFAARVRQEAVALNRAGDFRAAEARLRAVERRIGKYANRDPELRAIVAGLRDEQVTFSAAMPEMARKQQFFASANLARTRDAQGRARRA